MRPSLGRRSTPAQPSRSGGSLLIRDAAKVQRRARVEPAPGGCGRPTVGRQRAVVGILGVEREPAEETGHAGSDPRQEVPRLRSALAPGFGASAGLAAPHPWLSPVKGACRNRIKVASGWRFFCPEPHRRAKSAGRLRIGLPAPSVTFWLDLPAPLRSLGPRSQITALGAGTRERAPRRIDCPSPA